MKTRNKLMIGASIAAILSESFGSIRNIPNPNFGNRMKSRAGTKSNLKSDPYNPRKKLPADEYERHKIASKMTNWQNTQWMRAGMPKDINRMKHFASLERKVA